MRCSGLKSRLASILLILMAKYKLRLKKKKKKKSSLEIVNSKKVNSLTEEPTKTMPGSAGPIGKMIFLLHSSSCSWGDCVCVVGGQGEWYIWEEHLQGMIREET